jgi:hypothetical protein
MSCPDCENTVQRLREALCALEKIAGTAEAAKQPDPAAYLQRIAREAWLGLAERSTAPSMAPTRAPSAPCLST